MDSIAKLPRSDAAPLPDGHLLIAASGATIRIPPANCRGPRDTRSPRWR
ncbi:MAG TPA: hypothetical protein VG432_16830 [Gemmatimonadaceae bacterium]|nr:hypothetical protein [Gemmatimonadaceae bacterium]